MTESGEAQPRGGADGNPTTGGKAGEKRAPTLELQRLGAAVVGLLLVIIPAITSFYDGGILDFSVEAIFVAGGLGLPLTLVGFAATRQGRGLPARLYLLTHRVLTAALLVAAIVFALRDEPTAVLLFAGAVIVLGLLLVTKTGATHDVERGDASATTVATDDRR